LNDVEDLTFNLISNIDVEETNTKLAAYEEAHRESIAANKKIQRMTNEVEKQRQADQIRQTQRLREVALQESQEERKEKENARMDIINRLATERGDAMTIAREGEKVLQNVTNRRGPITTRTAIDSSNGTDIFAIRGLKQVMGAEPEKPYDPFGGMADIKEFVVIPDNPNLWNDYLGKLRKNDIYSAGGYSLNEFYARSLSDVFSGLDVFIGQEKVRDDRKASSKVGTAAAAIAVDTDAKMTDVFS
jgi:CDK-activating kinase assembly factor MAT1